MILRDCEGKLNYLNLPSADLRSADTNFANLIGGEKLSKRIVRNNKLHVTMGSAYDARERLFLCSQPRLRVVGHNNGTILNVRLSSRVPGIGCLPFRRSIRVLNLQSRPPSLNEVLRNHLTANRYLP